MLFAADHVLTCVQREIAQLQNTASSAAEGSALQSLGLALSLLAARERGGAANVHAQLQRQHKLLDDIGTRLQQQAAFAAPIARLRERIEQALNEAVVDRAESDWRSILEDIQSLAQTVVGLPGLDTATRDVITNLFTDWECADLREQLGSGATQAAASTELTQDRWRDYLRDRFDEPSLDVTSFKSLAGGFGKLTYLFDVAGKAIDGAYVLRRDLAVTLFDNDCHRIEKEYALIRAAFGKGFPAPDAVWLDTEHRLVQGGHFLVMRRSPGAAGGSVFQAKSAVRPTSRKRWPA